MQVLNELPGFREYRNALLVPEYGCLYDENGRVIKESCTFYGEDPVIKNKAPEKIGDVKHVKHSSPVVFAGKLSKHYGHFLIESISRLWFYFTHQGLRYVCFNSSLHLNRHIFRKKFLKKLGMLEHMHFFPKNTLFKRIIVPHPSFINRHKAYCCHALAPEKVALGRSYGFRGRLAYLSRRKLPGKKGKIIGEDKIEEIVRKNGGDVYYPERLSFEKQVEIINSYNIIAGCKGSALHSLLFKVSDIPLKVILFCGEEGFRNHEAVNKIKNIECEYVTGSLSRDPGCRKTESNKNQAVDLDMVRDAFYRAQAADVCSPGIYYKR